MLKFLTYVFEELFNLLHPFLHFSNVWLGLHYGPLFENLLVLNTDNKFHSWACNVSNSSFFDDGKYY